MKVLVTGVSGFIGSYLAERLINDGHHVAGLVRQTNRLNHPAFQRLKGQLEIHYGSLTDNRAVRQCVHDFRPDAVCHLGAITPVAYSFDHPVEVTETNYLGTVNLAEAVLDLCPKLHRFIFASSMETYGFHQPNTPFEEFFELHPACPYAVAKVAAERYLKYLHYAHQFPAVCIRQTNAYGRKENDYFVIEAIITQMLKSSTINLGDPRPIRNFLFIDDLVDMYVRLLTLPPDTPGIHGESFNTGPDNGLSIKELAAKIAGLIGWQGQINWFTRPRRPGEIFYLNSTPAKASTVFGWAPKVNLTDGLARTIEIWADNLGVSSKLHATTTYAGAEAGGRCAE
jgi:nucleoside-diphosphate-sugar epimerase